MTAQLVAKQKRLKEERVDNERLGEKERARQKAREEARATAHLVLKQKKLEKERVVMVTLSCRSLIQKQS